MNPNANLPHERDCVEIHDVLFTFRDIEAVVSTFYGRVAEDPLLKKPFSSVKDWPRHVEHLVHFWWARLGGTPYLQISYNPAYKHFLAGFNQEFLGRWLALFQMTLDEKLTPPQAQLWGAIAGRMGQALSAKNDFLIRNYQRELASDSE